MVSLVSWQIDIFSFFYAETSSFSIVFQLFFVDFSHRKVAGSRMREHQTAYGSMRLHHAVLSQMNADALHVDQFIQQIAYRNIG